MPINPLISTSHPNEDIKMTDTNVQTQFEIVEQITTKVQVKEQAKYQQPETIHP